MVLAHEHVRLDPESGRDSRLASSRLWANSGLMRRNKEWPSQYTVLGIDTLLAERSEEALDFSGKRGGLLHCSEMTALFHFRPALNIRVDLFR
jgi:hypothetical protein